jgi:hypothetical protein
MVEISACRPVMAKAMREPKMPRMPVNWPMTSLTHWSTRGRKLGPR